MSLRGESLQLFVDAASAAFDQFAKAPEARRSIGQFFAALERRGAARAGEGSRLPVCHHLDLALAIDTSYPSLTGLIEAFKGIEPMLEWRRRTKYDHTADDNFVDGHANAMIIGPGGLEERNDLWLGVTLMAPQVRYPDHDHAPEEVYLVLSEGEFQQGEGDWFSPGIGGSFYNIPGIKHAMRSVGTPLFAFWALLAERPH
ncbi:MULTISPECIES: dimethylsulfoniopropionate lyase [unclassified Rhizobium]|uniref:dimethylsulfoniopropionate lyase n=1 Tax=unclassified Rhizobium TaxID=2613769 RepID=UPI001A99531F|nr:MULTISPECIES: dimethylsulfoniopropionate lyase [unclassified Rhizobium]MBX5186134.1 transcriptional regulator [Rhizobium sp. NZLR5]MBX5191800.1 transcriptional regulator [Rhizobium sp. NZLR3b]MBX5199347.1 transcriptional regulator [Rhizobium sp. NZLR10]MBX5204574.1 transcriptional regulator [Rhizobium sp. NZLR1]QSZ23503.1 dimethylsulfoniopropionate lyase [Rhizobium sp. NZLR1]